MELTTFLLTLLLLILPMVYILKWTTKRSRFSKAVDAIPGPWAVPLLGSAIHVMAVPREKMFKHFNNILNTYKPIVRTWAGSIAEVHLMDPDHMEVIMSSSTHIEKAFIYDFLRPWLGDGLLNTTGNKWHSRRKLLTPTFHFKILESFMEVFAEKSDILVQKLKKESNGKGFNIYPYIALCALDIICETAMGTAINALEESESEYVSAVCDVSEITMRRVTKPWLYPDFIFYRSSDGKKFKKSLNILHGFTNKIIQERKQASLKKISKTETQSPEDVGIKRRTAFLDLLLEASDNGKVLSDLDIREEVDTFMFEGHDTTTVGIGWALFLLGLHPDIQEKVYQELDEIFQGSDRHPTVKDLQEMKYLERVIKETLRLYPSVAFVGRKLREDVVIGGYKIPAGCAVWLHIYHTHRMEKHFPNPTKFNPDNFLPERAQGRHPYAYVPFSAGLRNCIGQKFAMLEEKTVLSSILRHFKVKSLDTEENIQMVSELVLRPRKGINMIIEAR